VIKATSRGEKMGYCSKKSWRIFKIFFFLALFINPYITPYYKLQDIKYWEPDSPVWKKLTPSDHEKSPLKLGLKSGLIVRHGDSPNKLQFNIYPLFLWNAWGKQKQLREWQKELVKDNPFYLAPKSQVRYKEYVIDELTRIKTTFSEKFGEEFDYLKFNYTFFIVEVLAILMGSLVYLVFCALTKRFS
jgi:hypothetical protein